MIEASRIAPHLWQGSRPPPGPELWHHRFGALVLCAVEHQPRAVDFPGVEVIHAPNDDAERPPTPVELAIARRAAARVAQLLRNGSRVLVTCQQGRNRSGLVVALTLHNLTGASGRECAELVQARRANALTNPFFVATLAQLPGLPVVLRPRSPAEAHRVARILAITCPACHLFAWHGDAQPVARRNVWHHPACPSLRAPQPAPPVIRA